MDTLKNPAGRKSAGERVWAREEKLLFEWPVDVSQWLGSLVPVGSEIRMCSICHKGAGWQDSLPWKLWTEATCDLCHMGLSPQLVAGLSKPCM